MQLRSAVNKYTYDIQDVKHTDYYSTFIDDNVLTTSYPFIKPNVYMIEEGMDFVSTNMPSLVSQKTPFTSFIGEARTIYVDAEYVEWALLTKGSRRTEQISNPNTGITSPGINNSIFYLKLTNNWYKESDILTTDKNSSYLVRVAENPQSTGDGWLYKVQLVTNSPQHDYFPPELLAAGISWIRVGSPAAEGSSLYGSWQNDSMGYIKFRVPMSSHSQEGQITNVANRRVLRADMKDPRGNILKGQTKILPIALMQFMQDFDFAVEKSLLLNRLSDKVLIDRSSNKGISIGPGVMEFMEQSHIMDLGANEPVLDRLIDAGKELAFDRIDWKNRNWVVYTGSEGLERVSKEIETKHLMGGYKAPYDEDVSASRSGIPGMRAKAWDPGFYNKITVPFVGTFTFELWPVLDSEELFHVIDPSTGRPLSSQYYFIFDYGTGTGKDSNIQLIKKREEVFTFICGTESPAGPINTKSGMYKGYTSHHKGRYYDIAAEQWFGVRFKDTTRGCWIRPNIR